MRSFISATGISEFVVHPVPMVVTEGSVARFSCAVTSSPPATITWELNQSTLPLETDRYLLHIIHLSFVLYLRSVSSFTVAIVSPSPV